MKRQFRGLSMCAVVLLLGTSGAASAQDGVSNFLRSVTGAIGTKAKPEQQKGATTTMGVRGMDDDTQSASAPQGAGAEDFNLMEGWAASATEAGNMAKKKDLTARQVSLRSGGKS